MEYPGDMKDLAEHLVSLLSQPDLRDCNGPFRTASCKEGVWLSGLRLGEAVAQTTMGYYVDLDADDLAEGLWATHGTAATQSGGRGAGGGYGNNSGNIGPEPAKKQEQVSTGATAETSCRETGLDASVSRVADGTRTHNSQIHSLGNPPDLRYIPRLTVSSNPIRTLTFVLSSSRRSITKSSRI